jgi:hypothetical protein
MTADTAQPPKDLIGFLDFYLVKKAPFQLPENAKEWIVKASPWITLIIILIVMPAVLIALGITAAFVPWGGYGYYYGAWFAYAWIFLLVTVGLEVLALPGLFARKMSGWRMLFYARIVALVYDLLTYNVVGGLIGALISFYVLFQIRTMYRD